MPRSELVQVLLPGGNSHAVFARDDATVGELCGQLLSDDDGARIVGEVVGDGSTPQDADRGMWAVQRVLGSESNRVWADEELSALGDGASSSTQQH